MPDTESSSHERIDLHAHVFNLRYLPIAGILHQRGGVPKWLARTIAKLLNWRTADRIGRREALAFEREADRDIDDADPAAALAAGTPVELIDDPDVRDALALLDGNGRRLFHRGATAELRAAEARDAFARLYREVEAADHDNLFRSGREYLAWLKFLTHSEQFIVDRLLATYGDDVKLFIHHMMDMEHYYDPGNCYYDFVGEQVLRMKRLVDANGGRLLTFVAWSPKRPNGISVVQRALEEGIAVGVKVYPPSGYTADEQMNGPLYDYCAPRGIPLFAHCTPVGFEARDGYGKRSDPVYWRNVLSREQWRTLRLCLAHAGGADPWFGDTWDGTFAQRAYDLAVEFEHVYCEFGYHAEILDADRRRAFVATLAQKIEESGGKFGHRIVYGTDWHMIEKEHEHEAYYRAFAEAFADERLKPYAQAFFYDNAIRYMNLSRFSERRAIARGEDDPVRQHVERVIAATRR